MAGSVNTTARIVNTGGSPDNLKSGSDKLNAHWHEYSGATLTNRTGGGLVLGDVVALDTATDSSVVASDVASSRRDFVVAQATISNLAAGEFAISGVCVVKAQGTINRGEYVRKSGTAKAVESTGVAISSTAEPPAGSIGICVSPSAGGFATVHLFDLGIPRPRAIGARVRSTVQTSTVTTGNILAVPFNAERWDTDGCHDNVTNNTRLTCNTAGKYVITGHGVVDNGTGGNICRIYIVVNGTTAIGSQTVYVHASVNTPATVTATWDLAVGDYVELYLANDTTGIDSHRLLASAGISPEFEMILIGQ